MEQQQPVLVAAAADTVLVLVQMAALAVAVLAVEIMEVGLVALLAQQILAVEVAVPQVIQLTVLLGVLELSSSVT
jgi:hypothetical protein